MASQPPASLPVLLTEASLRETTEHQPVDTLLDLAVELRPLGVDKASAAGNGSAHALARRAFNARLRGETSASLR